MGFEENNPASSGASVPLAGGTSTGKQTFAAGIQITDDDGTTTIDGYRALAFLTPPAADDAVLGLGFKYPDAFAAGLNYAESDAFVMLSDADNGATLPANILKVISATTNATPVAVTTSTAHGFTTGDIVRITGTGIAALDGKFWKIAVTDTTHFTLNGSTAPGSTAAVGYAFSDQGAPLSRIADTGPGFTGAMHLAAGLRGRSGGSLPTYGFWIQPAADVVPLIIHNAATDKWGPTPASDYLQIVDARSSPARSLIRVETDGTITLRNQAGKADGVPLFRVRDESNASDLFAVQLNGSGVNGQVIIPVGAGGLPSLVFVGDTTTGLYRAAASTIGFSAGGSSRMNLNTTRLQFTDAINLAFGTTTGTQIGTATSQKIGFWAHTPVVQPSATPAAATDLATVITLANYIRASVCLATGLSA